MTSRRKRLLWVFGPFLCFIMLVGGYTGYELLTGNVHSLPDGQVFRSGQLTSEQMDHMIRDHKIRSVLNLRGASRGEWYQAETNLCASLGVEHSSFKLSARRELTEEEMDKLVGLIRGMSKPMLIHCTGGADRTSLACALYRMDVAGEAPRVAVGELGILYGHIPHFQWRYSIAMDHSFWLHVTNHTSGPHSNSL